MSETERLIRIGYYAKQLSLMFQMANFGDAGYRAAGLVRCITMLTWLPKTDSERMIFEHYVKAGEFSQSDQDVREAGI